MLCTYANRFEIEPPCFIKFAMLVMHYAESLHRSRSMSGARTFRNLLKENSGLVSLTSPLHHQSLIVSPGLSGFWEREIH